MVELDLLDGDLQRNFVVDSNEVVHFKLGEYENIISIVFYLLSTRLTHSFILHAQFVMFPISNPKKLIFFQNCHIRCSVKREYLITDEFLYTYVILIML